MIGSSGPVILGTLPPATFDALYAGGPDVVRSRDVQPDRRGHARSTGGYRVTGRWAFASGCQHADWFIAHCIVDDGRVPPLRMMVLPADDVEIVDTWSVSGLCGTGSHDFTLDGVFVPDERTFAVFDEGGVRGPPRPHPGAAVLVTGDRQRGARHRRGRARRDHDAGHGQGADVRRRSRWPATRCSATGSAKPSAHLRAAEALLDADIAATWATAVAGDEFTPPSGHGSGAPPAGW